MTRASSPTVDVVIPVYGGVEFVEMCIESVVRCTAPEHRILVVDDASPSAETRALLDRLAATTRIELRRNDENLGFVRTVNRAFALSETHDVVVLNSDTVVTPHWLEGLRSCAYSDASIGTCSPLTNCGSIFAVPEPNRANPIPEGWTVDDVARAVARFTRRSRPETPTSHGFCMYVKRAYLDDVGSFDEEAFGLGYGEENDLCLRGRERGWIHVVDDATFVFHRGSMSFSERKEQLYRAHRRVIDERYPYYSALIRRWMVADPLFYIRQRLAAAFEAAPTTAAPHGRVLFVLHDGRGGVHHTARDLAQGLNSAWETWILTSDRARLRLELHVAGRCVEARTFELSQPIELIDVAHREYAQLFERVLDEVRPDLVHVRHLLAHSPRAIDLAKRRGLPVVLSFHDHYTICPTIHLIDNRGRFCGGDCNDDAEDCRLIRSWFPAQPRLKHHFLPLWRREMEDRLKQVDAFVTTSEATRAIHERHFPLLRGARVEVIEHGRDFDAVSPVIPRPDGVFRIISFGAFNFQKGLDLLEALAVRCRQSPVEIHLAGTTSRPVRDGVHVHGPYAREELNELMHRLRPDVALIPSIMSETFCHTLSEAWAFGLPVVAARRGALEERVEREGGGWLFEPQDVDELHRLLLRLLNDPEEVERVRCEVGRIRHRSNREMAEDYDRVYRSVVSVGASSPSGAPDILARAEARAAGIPIRSAEPITGRHATKVLLYKIPRVRRILPWVMQQWGRVRR